MSRVRQRRVRDQRAEHQWEQRREEEVSRWQRTGLLVRPTMWWKLDAPRPDLAELGWPAGERGRFDYGSGSDSLAHMRPGPILEGAKQRLRYLLDIGELTTAELAAFAVQAQSGSPRWTWRTEIVEEFRATRAGRRLRR